MIKKCFENSVGDKEAHFLDLNFKLQIKTTLFQGIPFRPL